MENAANVLASDVETENPVSVSNDKNLAQIKTRMENEDIRAIIVLNGDSFEGVIGYRDLIRHLQFNPQKTKISKVLHQPPEYSEDDSLVDLCDLRINSGRKLLVRTKGGKIQGAVGDNQFLEASKEIKEIASISSANLASDDILTTFEEDSLEQARHSMLDNNVSRLPVLDENGNLTGIIKSTDLLKAMIPMEAQNSGGTSGSRSGNEVKMAGGGEKEQMSSIPVKELMDRTVTTAEEHMKSDKAAETMIENESGEIIFVDGNYPESILTVKDLIDHIENLKASDTVLVQLVGIEVPEEKAALHEKIKTQLRGSLGRKLERPEELTVHIKKAEKDGTKHRYEFNVKLYSEYGVTTVQAEGWELLDVMDEALEELNTVVGKKKDKRDDREKERGR